MLRLLIRTAKRFAVLIPGLVITYLSIFNIFPWLNDHLPVVLAVVLTYLLAAYVLIPALIRVARIFFPPSHLPLYCVTPDGFASDPLNIALIGTRSELIAAMTGAGWFQADKHTLRNALHEGLATVYGWSYPEAPMSHLYLFGRQQDIGFQIPIADAPAGSRHHVRFWATTYDDSQGVTVRSIDWRHRKEQIRSDRLLWVGAASRDVGVSFIRHNAQLTHMIDPDTDSERDLIVRQLRETKLGVSQQTIRLGQPYTLRNRVWRGYLQTDGQMATMKLTKRTADLSQGASERTPKTAPPIPTVKS